MKDRTGKSGKDKERDRRTSALSSELAALSPLPLFSSPLASGHAPSSAPENADTQAQFQPPQNSTQLIQRLETVLDSITDIYIAYDGRLRFTDLNDRAEKELGKKAAEIVGKHFSEVFPEMTDSEYHHRCQAALSSRKPEHFEAHSTAGKWYEAHAYPTQEGLSVYMKDITKRKQVEQALQDLNESLEQRVAERTAEARELADELRALAGELSQAEQRERKRLASVLHDHIQQLLVAAKMQLNLLQRSDSEGIQAAAQSIESILNDAIAASRSLAVELSPPILHRAGLAAALGWLATRMEEKSLFKVHVRADSDAEPAGEPVRLLLFDSVRELLLNAVKYSGVSEAAVRMERTPEGWTRIVVEDKGNGLDVAALNSRKDPGFGLFSVHQRLAYLGGRMEIESALGQGTRVTLLAPPESVPATAPRPAAALAAADRERPTQPQKGRKISVLLVDDHKLVRQGLSSLLQRQPDLDVVGAVEDGQKALELARELKPDVVVTAVGAPDMDGVELTRTLRRELPGTKVVGLSVHIETDLASAMREAGAASFLTKGGPSEELIAAIRACAPRTQPASRTGAIS